MYEGYGPGGSALLVQVLTDNRNRAASDIRRLFSRLGGNLAAANAVAWLFEKKGVISVETDGQNADDVELQVIDAGAEDFRQDGNLIEVTTAPGDLKTVRDALEKMHVKIDSAELAWVPKNLARIGEAETEQSMHLIDTLEELDDVQKVYSNLDISEAVLARFEAAKEGA
jgi:YebC/PmpR family DNA-binding regulatory protein